MTSLRTPQRLLAVPAALLLGAALAQSAPSPAQSAPSPAGNWTFTATGSDGTVLQQAVTLRQFAQQGRTYLSAGGYTALLSGDTAGLSLTWRDADAVRTLSGSVRFAGNSASGSALLREVYPSGEVQTTRFVLRGRR